MTIYPEPEMASPAPVPALQRTFDRSSVYDALMTAQSAEDMGGTTGGAFRVPTTSRDPERSTLVVKISGDTEDLAARMGETLGLVLPKAIKINLDEALLGAFGRASGLMRAQIESARKHEVLVQQFAGPGMALANEGQRGRKSSNETYGNIAMFDFLLGNRDRFTNQTSENLLGTIPIDNKISTHRDEMGPTVSGLLEDPDKISPYVGKEIDRTLRGSLRTRRDKLQVQRGILTMLQEIQLNARGLQGLIDEDAGESRKRSEQMLAAFDAIEKGKVLGSGSNKGEDIDPSILNQELQGLSKDLRIPVEQILASNTSTFRADLEKDPGSHQAGLRRTIEEIGSIKPGVIGGALRAVDAELRLLDEQDLERHADWRAARAQALLTAEKTWNSKWGITKFFSNKATTIRELMAPWLRLHPEPWLPPHLRG